MRLMNDEAKRDSKRMRWLADRFVRPMNEAIGAHLVRAQGRPLLQLPPVYGPKPRAERGTIVKTLLRAWL